MKRRIALFGILAVFVSAAWSAFAVSDVLSQNQDLMESIGANGQVNWSVGYVEATGIGAPPERYYGKPQARPMALRAAQVDAYRNLLEIVKGVRVDAVSDVRDHTVNSDIIRAQVEGFVKGAIVVQRDYLSDGTVEVTVRMPLNGDFSQALLPKVVKSKTFDRPGAALASRMPVVPPAVPQAVGPPAQVYTGMVVDARGIQARPAMVPKIIDENGREVYGSMAVDREYAVQQGMSGYARDLTLAQTNARVTNNPITIKGTKTDGPGRSNIVISNADAERIRAAADSLSFLEKARVMIVLD